jgi:bifunctional non-homologous end joining protein LigD
MPRPGAKPKPDLLLTPRRGRSPANEKQLEEYRKKRDFEKTPEPPPGPGREAGHLMFVIQKHAATRLHYDFRLEFDGVLKSWPIPKGPSLDPKERRLAVMTEDHPLDYASFEGVIPKGSYGAGQVIVWDTGTYSPDEGGVLSFEDREEAERRMMEGLAKGKISVFLLGHKLKGSFTLVKTKTDWLAIKHKDSWVDPDRDVTQEDRSVLSGLSLEDIKAGRLPDRQRSRLVVNPDDAPGAIRASFPRSIEPMQGTLTKEPFSAPDWYFEPKLDGVRAIAFIDGNKVKLNSRRGLDTTKQYPEVADDLSLQVERQMVVDGEIVAMDERGVPSFQQIQQRLGLQREADIRKMAADLPVFYFVYDLLYVDGYDLRCVPLSDRKTLLKQRLLPTSHVLLLDHFEEEGEEAYEAALTLGMEGVMAKRRDSLYESGKRSKAWLKVKGTSEDEFVIGGFTGGAGGRNSTFGSVLVGQYTDDGKLVYVGHVGTGFNDRTLATLRKRLEDLKTDQSPFDVMEPGTMRFARPTKNQPTTWVKPELVAAVEFAEWTNDGHLRAPSFKGMREDKAPRDVQREIVAPPPAEAATASETKPPAGDELQDVLEQLGQKSERFVLQALGEKVSLTNLDKPLWPDWEGRRPLTKRDLLTYFTRVSPVLLPHMRDRPITLTRYPNGINDPHFYQKHFEFKIPGYVDTCMVWSGQYQEDQEYILCNNLPTLLWLGQLADIELHTWYSRVAPEPDGYDLHEYTGGGEEAFDASRLNYPDFIVFDLDPYIYSGEEKKGAEPELNRQAFLKTCEVAFQLKDLLDALSLSSYVKTTGKTGLHVYVPILREFDYDTVRAAAATIGKFLLRAHPRDITMEWSTDKRTGKVFFDHNQNTKGKTLASLYSPRPVPWAGVSMPVRWDELRDIYPQDFTILNACDRVDEVGDLWADILNQKHDLRALLEAAEGIE